MCNGHSFPPPGAGISASHTHTPPQPFLLRFFFACPLPAPLVCRTRNLRARARNSSTMVSIKAAARASILVSLMIATVLAEPGGSKLREDPLSALVRPRIANLVYSSCSWLFYWLGSYAAVVRTVEDHVPSVTCIHTRGSLEADFLAAVCDQKKTQLHLSAPQDSNRTPRRLLAPCSVIAGMGLQKKKRIANTRKRRRRRWMSRQKEMTPPAVVRKLPDIYLRMSCRLGVGLLLLVDCRRSNPKPRIFTSCCCSTTT